MDNYGTSALQVSPAANLQIGPWTYSYLELRRTVGIIGALFPPVLAIGNLIAQSWLPRSGPFVWLQCSISNYYHTDMRNVFVGSLCVIGFFLLATRGYRVPDNKDEIAGRLACVFAVGVAMFPTTECSAIGITLIAALHWISAALLFFTLAYFCIKLFTRTAQKGNETERKLQRNKVYKACGITIIVSIVLIPAARMIGAIKSAQPEFWLETIAVEAFAFAWLTKGEMFLKDRPWETRRKLQDQDRVVEEEIAPQLATPE